MALKADQLAAQGTKSSPKKKKKNLSRLLPHWGFHTLHHFLVVHSLYAHLLVGSMPNIYASGPTAILTKGPEHERLVSCDPASEGEQRRPNFLWLHMIHLQSFFSILRTGRTEVKACANCPT